MTPVKTGCQSLLIVVILSGTQALIWAPGRANMGRHIMKATIEIADDLFRRAQHVAREEKTTLRALTEQGLRLVLKERETKAVEWKWTPVVVHGKGLNEQFRKGGWDKLRGLSLAAQLTGPRIHDARIAALCLHHGVRELWTADRDFSLFPSLKTRNPLIQGPTAKA
jgi:predicted nucleic acid-binding protein